MKYQRLFISLWAFCSLIPVDRAFAEQNDSDAPYRIGVILPLSGELAQFGESVRAGIALGVEDNISLCQSASPSRRCVDVFFEDDRAITQQATQAFQKLRAENRVEAVISFTSSAGHVIAPLAETHQMPHLAFASDGKITHGRKLTHLFWVTPEMEARLAMQEAIRRRYLRVLPVISVQEGAFAIADAFRREAQSNVSVVSVHSQIEIPMTERDFRATVARLRQGPEFDAIFLVVLSGAGEFARQVRANGITVPIFGAESFDSQSELDAARGALDGSWFVTGGSGTEEFLNRLRSRYPNAIIGAAHGYDAVSMFGAASREGRDAYEISRFISSQREVSGAVGVYSATDDNRFELPAVLKAVENGRVVPIAPGDSSAEAAE